MAAPTQNRQWLLASRPKGFPLQSDFKFVTTPVPEPGPGQVLVRNLWVSVDPYMRGRMNDIKSYAQPWAIGGVAGGGAVGKVAASQNPKFKAGDFVESMALGWQDYALSDGRGLRVVDASLAPISTAIGVLGMPGLTAYFGLLEIGQPKAGETVLVSGGAGAVGSLVGQIAKIAGCRAVGIAGSDDKVRWMVNDLGFDAAFNYKSTRDYRTKIRELCPSGVDVYFDNVGGDITDAAFDALNSRARISICGRISSYNLDKPDVGPRLFGYLLTKQARAEGFLVFQFAERYREGLAKLAEWLRAGQLKYKETVVEGLENTPQAFLGMLKGENIGKEVVHVADA